MNVEITKEMYEAVGGRNGINFKPWDVGGEESVRWSSTSINLQRYSTKSVESLRQLLASQQVKGSHRALQDLTVWLEAAKVGPGLAKCKNVKQFASLVYEYMQRQPKFRLYEKDEKRGVWHPYYLSNIQYTPRSESRGGVTPAHTTLTLCWSELGVVESATEVFHDGDVRNLTVPAALQGKGYVPESPALLKTYQSDLAFYQEHYDKVGRQFLATGVGTTNLDDVGSWCSKTVVLSRDGAASQLVVDIVHESDEKQKRDRDHIDYTFWQHKSLLDAEEGSDDSLDDVGPNDADLSVDGEDIPVEVPVFPLLPMFDLRRHLRMRVHVSNLTEYVYDERLGDKLVLPTEVRDLVSLLISDKSEFRDIVKGKGGGAVILCAGPPGCGKTLTSEVYAEVMKKPLYSVQCSQLGTNEEELEKHLLLVFARAQRWDAILLLDEADVYVAARGNDLRQNAIVGVFLRVLEYYSGVLFMTTNRSDLVDDAITSRCLARIDYAVPTREDQARIWNVLAKLSGIALAPGLVDDITRKYPVLSGRDVKQLLKLASKVMASRGESKLTLKTVEFVKRFKPTPGDGKVG